MAKKERRARRRALGQSKTTKKALRTPLNATPQQTSSLQAAKKTTIGFNKLYSHPQQHLTVDDPDTIFLSATTPTRNLVNYIIKRLTAVGEQNYNKILEFCPNHPAIKTNINDIPTTDLPPLDTVTIMAVNSCTQRAVSVVEILKRRIPTLYTNIQIGLIDNTARLQAVQQSGAKAGDMKKNQDGDDAVDATEVGLYQVVPPAVASGEIAKPTKGKKKATQRPLEPAPEVTTPTPTENTTQTSEATTTTTTTTIPLPKFNQTAYALKITLLLKQTIAPVVLTAEDMGEWCYNQFAVVRPVNVPPVMFLSPIQEQEP